MKTRILVTLGVSLAMASQAWASDPVSPVQLGGVDAVLSFCGQINPSGVAAYSAFRTSFVSQTSAEVLAAAPSKGGYKKAFAEVGSALSEAPSLWALTACAKLAAQ